LSEGALARFGKPRVFPRTNKKLKVPNGWRQCRNFGEPINETFIFSIRVPLDARFRAKVQNGAFEPQHVLDWQDSAGLKIGLVIDLTFTDKYYNGTKEFVAEGVEYKKIPTKGHGATPKIQDVQTFIATVTEFRRRRPDAYIAVHCTHGLNRSGFMIISYLVDVLRMHLTTAFAAFAISNPPGMWDPEYIRTLYKQYGVPLPKEEDLPSPPAWNRRVATKSGSQTKQSTKDHVNQERQHGVGEVVIMRGLPGSGKTTSVKMNFAESEVCSADAFFMNGQAGYAYDRDNIGEAHQMCLASFLKAIKVGFIVFVYVCVRLCSERCHRLWKVCVNCP
jgi:mRNA-capping enzyme